MNSAKVFIVDDDPAVRDSLCLLFETAGLAGVGLESAEAFLETYRGEQAGCLVLDVRMTGMSGPDLFAELHRMGSHLPVIFLTAHGDIPTTVRAMKAGAVDFLTKPVDADRLLDLVRSALAQNEQLLSRLESRGTMRNRLAELTPREREIMALILAGQTNKEIARQLGISHRTVEIHRANLLRKTATGSVLELAHLEAECRATLDGEDHAGAPDRQASDD